MEPTCSQLLTIQIHNLSYQQDLPNRADEPYRPIPVLNQGEKAFPHRDEDRPHITFFRQFTAFS